MADAQAMVVSGGGSGGRERQSMVAVPSGWGVTDQQPGPVPRGTRRWSPGQPRVQRTRPVELELAEQIGMPVHPHGPVPTPGRTADRPSAAVHQGAPSAESTRSPTLRELALGEHRRRDCRRDADALYFGRPASTPHCPNPNVSVGQLAIQHVGEHALGAVPIRSAPGYGLSDPTKVPRRSPSDRWLVPAPARCSEDPRPG